MLRVVISPAAARDMESILARSREQFGAAARKRYVTLLERAIRDVSDDPDRAGCMRRDEIAPGVRTYHLMFSRERAARSAAQRVKRPRHLLLYRVQPDGQLELGRVLHDSMDLDRHVPHEFQD